MKGYLLALALLAVAAGAFFRVADSSGVSRFREWAWISLLVFGLLGNAAIARWQRADARKRLWDAFAEIGPGFSVVQPGVPGPPGEDATEYVVIAPGGVIAMVLEEASNLTRAGTARRRAAAAAASAAEVLRVVVGAAPAGALGEARQEAVVVFTRRRISDLGSLDRAAEAVRVLNPDLLAEYLRGWRAPERLPQAERLELRRRVQSLPVARFRNRQL